MNKAKIVSLQFRTLLVVGVWGFAYSSLGYADTDMVSLDRLTSADAACLIVANIETPKIGKVMPLKESNSGNSSSGVIIELRDGSEFRIPIDRLLRARLGGQEYMVRYSSETLDYEMCDLGLYRSNAKKSLAMTGHVLFPSLPFEPITVPSQEQVEASLDVMMGPHWRGTLQIDVHPSFVLVTERTNRQKEEVFFAVYGGRSQAAAFMRLPTKMSSALGKPIVCVLSGGGRDGKITVETFTKALHRQLDQNGFSERPAIHIHCVDAVNRETMAALYQESAKNFLEHAYSTKALPRWLSDSLTVLNSPSDNQSGAMTVRDKFDDINSFIKQLQSDGDTDVDPVLGLEFTRQLFFTNPYGFSEFLVDLKHGKPLRDALRDQLNTTLANEVSRFAEQKGIASSNGDAVSSR